MQMLRHLTLKHFKTRKERPYYGVGSRNQPSSYNLFLLRFMTYFAAVYDSADALILVGLLSEDSLDRNTSVTCVF
jgi:hypothetical protein